MLFFAIVVVIVTKRNIFADMVTILFSLFFLLCRCCCCYCCCCACLYSCCWFCDYEWKWLYNFDKNWSGDMYLWVAHLSVALFQELRKQGHKLYACNPWFSHEDCCSRAVSVCLAQEIWWVVSTGKTNIRANNLNHLDIFIAFSLYKFL